jgi:hypothetical protein
VARLILITHLPPREILNLTPDQTEILLEEYVARNQTGDEPQKIEPQALGLSPHSAETVDSDLARRVKAEMAEKFKPKT